MLLTEVLITALGVFHMLAGFMFYLWVLSTVSFLDSSRKFSRSLTEVPRIYGDETRLSPCPPYRPPRWAYTPWAQSVAKEMIVTFLTSVVPMRDRVDERREVTPEGHVLVWRTKNENAKNENAKNENAKNAKNSPIVMVMHGLGGDATGSNEKAFTLAVCERGWRTVVWNVSHSEVGKREEHTDLVGMQEVVDHVRSSYPDAVKTFLVGMSGGSISVVKYQAHVGEASTFDAAVSVCNPHDLVHATRTIARERPVVDMYLSHCFRLAGVGGMVGYDVKSLEARCERLRRFYEDSCCHKDLVRVVKPLLCVCNEDDPLIPVELVCHAINATRTNPGITCVVTRRGGHTAWLQDGGSWRLQSAGGPRLCWFYDIILVYLDTFFDSRKA
jgi:predicted alpha/beta-fold hydrolase